MGLVIMTSTTQRLRLGMYHFATVEIAMISCSVGLACTNHPRTHRSDIASLGQPP
jgi:hypothetical protein